MANVNFYRGTTTKIDSIPISDGNILFDTDKKDISVDTGTTRARFGGGSLSTTDIIDDLTSTDTSKPLSANMGRTLNSSINEVKTIANTNTSKIGDVSSLTTTAKTVVPAINEITRNLDYTAFGPYIQYRKLSDWESSEGHYEVIYRKYWSSGTAVTSEYGSLYYYPSPAAIILPFDIIDVIDAQISGRCDSALLMPSMADYAYNTIRYWIVSAKSFSDKGFGIYGRFIVTVDLL